MFAFQQPPEYRQRRFMPRRWRQTVPDARTGDTECTVAHGSQSRSGTSSLAEAEDRSLLRDSEAATGCSWSARYGGAVPWRQRKTSTFVIRAEAGADSSFSAVNPNHKPCGWRPLLSPQVRGYLPSRTASPPFDQYQIILLETEAHVYRVVTW